MALIDCGGCGRKISDKATVCPNCGWNVAASIVKEEEKKICADCGQEIDIKSTVCPFCGCPADAVVSTPQKVEVTKIQLGTTNKKTKKIIIFSTITILLVALITVGIVMFNNKKQKAKVAEDYKTNLELATITMLNGAAEAETAGNLIHNVWYNSIYEESNSNTNKYTRRNNGEGGFYDDFNDALSQLFSDQTFINQIDTIESNQKSVNEIMKLLANPTEEFQDAYSALKDFYNAYYEFTSLVTNPTGSLQTFTENFNNADTEVLKYYNAMSLFVDLG